MATGDSNDPKALDGPSAGTQATGPSSGSPGGNQLVRVTVNLVPAAMDALERLSAHGGTKTDVMNRALQIAALVQELLDRNGGRLRIKHNDGTEETLYIL